MCYCVEVTHGSANRRIRVNFVQTIRRRHLKKDIPPISIREWEAHATEKYSECPKHITIVRHADLEDDSEFHCVIATPFVGPLRPGEKANYRRNFIIPGQDVMLVKDPEFGLFSIVRVMDEHDGSEHILFTGVNSRMGFVLPMEQVPPELLQTEEHV
jgi:hypothetical protein